MGRARLCVFCRKRPSEPEWRPFCSERCKTLDLARWADGSYHIPGERIPPETLGSAQDPGKKDEE